MAEILQFYTEKDDAYSLHRLQCLQNLNSMYELMDCGLHMGKETILQFKKVTDLCLLHFARCAKLAKEAGLLQWNLTRTTLLPTCLLKLHIWTQSLSQHTQGKQWWDLWPAWPMPVWMEVLPTWYLKKSCGGSGWECGWNTSMDQKLWSLRAAVVSRGCVKKSFGPWERAPPWPCKRALKSCQRAAAH